MIFRAMLELEQRAGCELACIDSECETCRDYCQQHDALHSALRLRPWEWPAYSNFEDDDPKAMRRYDALKAASDARR